MDNLSLGILVGLRYCPTICSPHQCQHCQDVHGTHVLSKSTAREYTTGTYPSMTSIGELSLLPSYHLLSNPLACQDKWPDDVTLVPWACGQLLVWNTTCPDSLIKLTNAAGKVAAVAEESNTKYTTLGSPTFSYLQNISNRELGKRI